jgi:prevent-host-death family protein
MERVISATEARVKFGELMQRVADNDETVIVERDGVPRIAILSIDSYKHLKGEESPWERWEADLRRLHERLRSELGDSRLPTSVEMIHQMRAERDEQLANLR